MFTETSPDVKLIRVLIPSTAPFQHDAYPGAVLLSQQDMEIMIRNNYLIFKSEGEFYAATGKNKCPQMQKYVITCAAENPDVVFRAMNLSNLEADFGTSVKINAEHTISATKMQIANPHELDFWGLKPAANGDLQFAKLDDYSLTSAYEIITKIDYAWMQNTSDRRLCIKANTKLHFQKQSYTLPHDVFLVTQHSIYSSYCYHNRFHLNTDVRELTVNPFQDGVVTPSEITLLYENTAFTVSSELFRSKISGCQFVSDNNNLYVKTGTGPMEKTSYFTWKLKKCQHLHDIRMLVQAIRSHDKFPNSLYVDRVQKIEADIDNDQKDAIFRLYQVILEMGGTDFFQNLVSEKSKDIALRAAITCKNLEMVQYLFMDNFVPSNQIDWIRKAIEADAIPILKFLMSQNIPLKDTMQYYVDLALNLGLETIHQFLSTSPQNILLHQRQVVSDIETLQTSFQKLTNLLNLAHKVKT